MFVIIWMILLMLYLIRPRLCPEIDVRRFGNLNNFLIVIDSTDIIDYGEDYKTALLKSYALLHKRD